MTHTPGRWKWWTSNSWRRLRSDVGRGQTIDVLHPWVCHDGQPDIIVSPADMALIEAAPDMLMSLLGLQVIAEQHITDLAADAEAGNAIGNAVWAMEWQRWHSVIDAIERATNPNRVS
jgi:hypothetical protein